MATLSNSPCPPTKTAVLISQKLSCPAPTSSSIITTATALPRSSSWRCNYYNHCYLTTCRSPNQKTGWSYRYYSSGVHDDEDDVDCSFEESVVLFNSRDYYRCHDLLEAIWNKSQEPTRTLVHGILQCAVGFHHLFNRNHRGAMMELGEGLCKLRKMNLESGPFHEFEKDISAVLEFIYQTQLELAACADDFCLTLDQSERSYKLLGGYAAGERLYSLETDADEIVYIVFCPARSCSANGQPRVKLPTLHASEENFMAF